MKLPSAAVQIAPIIFFIVLFDMSATFGAQAQKSKQAETGDHRGSLSLLTAMIAISCQS